tara:strand:+ start:167983 stop:168858 length:876 start_codon:yes stop_codon:yes gene_type:complete
MVQFNKISFIGLFSILTLSTFAGGWPQPKKSGFFQLSERWMRSNEHFTDKGLLDPNVTTGLVISSVYGEYGLNNNLTVRAYIPFLVSNFQNNIISSTRGTEIEEGQILNAFGDVILGADRLLYKNNKISLTVGVSIGLATGTIGKDEKQNLQTGDGENNVAARIDLGASLFNSESLSIYGKLGTAYNKRTKDFSDEIQSQAEMGFIIKQKYFIISKFFNVTSMQNGITSGEQISAAGVFANNAEFNAFELLLATDVYKGYHLTFAVNTILSGKIVANGTAYEVGVFKKIQW